MQVFRILSADKRKIRLLGHIAAELQRQRDAISPNPPRVGVFRNYSRFSDFAPSAALKFRKNLAPAGEEDEETHLRAIHRLSKSNLPDPVGEVTEPKTAQF